MAQAKAKPSKTKSASKSKATKSKSKSTKSKTTRAKGKGKRSRTPTPRFRLSAALPGRVSEIESLKNLVERIDDADATRELNEALDRLQERTAELYDTIQGRAGSLEVTAKERLDEQLEDVRDRANTLVEKAQETRAGKLLQSLPQRAASELDELLARAGLMRVAAHDDEVEMLKHRYKGLMKAAGTRARNQALKEAKKLHAQKTKTPAKPAKTDA